jgi:hypothetical protein
MDMYEFDGLVPCVDSVTGWGEVGVGSLPESYSWRYFASSLMPAAGGVHGYPMRYLGFTT